MKEYYRSKILRATCKYKYDRRSNKFISGEFTLTHNSFGEFILQQQYYSDSLGKMLYIFRFDSYDALEHCDISNYVEHETHPKYILCQMFLANLSKFEFKCNTIAKAAFLHQDIYSTLKESHELDYFIFNCLKEYGGFFKRHDDYIEPVKQEQSELALALRKRYKARKASEKC